MWLRWEQSVIYFVTICVSNRKPVLANENAFLAFKKAAAKLRDWTVLAGILMPDHIHVIVAPTQDRDAKLGNCVAALKRWMRQELNASWKWQPDSFDRLLRSDKSLGDKWLYLEENPVGAGLIQRYAIVKQPHRSRGLGSASGAPALQFSYILKRSPK